MRELERMHSQAASHYRLAWLLTGERALSARSNPKWSFTEWMSAWSRRVTIARVLTGIRGELAESARRTAATRIKNQAFRPGSVRPGDGITAIQLECALQTIDVFPRWSLVLTVFEGISVEDAAVLLDATADLVRKARTLGLRQLVDNLTRIQVRTSDGYGRFVRTIGVQHA